MQLRYDRNFGGRLLHLHPHSPKLRPEALSLVGYRRENIPFLVVVYDHERVVQFSTDMAFVRNAPHLVLLAITFEFLNATLDFILVAVAVSAGQV